jgi:hypothetical protein
LEDQDKEASIEMGLKKLLQNTNPLYVIDGLVLPANRDLINDIETIQVLKDTAAAILWL